MGPEQQSIIVKPDVKVVVEKSEVNYWWSLTLVIIPIVLTYYLSKRNKTKGKK